MVEHSYLTGTCQKSLFTPRRTANKARPFSSRAPSLWQKSAKRATLFDFSTVFIVPLGSVPELPAESCAEVRASEGEDAVSVNYWFDSIKPGDVVLARCNMLTQGNYRLSGFQLDLVLKSVSPSHYKSLQIPGCFYHQWFCVLLNSSFFQFIANFRFKTLKFQFRNFQAM